MLLKLLSCFIFISSSFDISKTDNDKIKMYEVAFRIRVEKPHHMKQIDPNWPNHMEQIKAQLKEKQQQRLQKL